MVCADTEAVAHLSLCAEIKRPAQQWVVIVAVGYLVDYPSAGTAT